MGKKIIVSNRLPVRIESGETGLEYKLSEGGLATGLGFIMDEPDSVWIGWPGLEVDNKAKQDEVKEELGKKKLIPVFLSEKEIEEFYEGFSNETLWPAFHYFVQYIKFEQNLWESYLAVNQKFCDAILEVLEPGDTLWIQDYQLLPLSEMVRKAEEETSIGFFQHIPFPSYEVFRMIPWRKELLNGMLGADLIGFHTYDDVRHFLSCASRLVGVSNEHGELQIGNRIVNVDAFPLGIDYDKYAASSASPDTLSKEVRYRTSLGNHKLILSIDRLDYSKGIPYRLRAFDLFLKKHPEFLEKVSLMLIVVPSRDSVGKYKELKEEVDLLVGGINSKYGRIAWNPIHYYYRSYPLDSLSAFYRMADVMLVNPMRDGMNLVCKEYIASKLDQKGVLILSEMAGASKELSDAILINPNNQNEIAEAIYTGLTMPVDEQKGRMQEMQKSLKRYNVFEWVKLFLSRLNHIKDKQHALVTKKWSDVSQKLMIEQYAKAKNPLFLLDYDGTLMPFDKDPMNVSPDKELVDILTKLTSNTKNDVVVISGRDAGTLEKWLGKFSINLIGEHGQKGKKKGIADWFVMEEASDEWKDEVRELMELYVSRTPGSFIEEKEFALVWHFRKVETGLGELRSRELTSHLKYLTTNSELQVLEGDMVLEVKPSSFNKGISTKKWIKENGPYDFVLAIGDDTTDEDTFKAVPQSAFTVKVGGSFSSARYAVKDHLEVRELLKRLI